MNAKASSTWRKFSSSASDAGVMTMQIQLTQMNNRILSSGDGGSWPELVSERHGSRVPRDATRTHDLALPYQVSNAGWLIIARQKCCTLSSLLLLSFLACSTTAEVDDAWLMSILRCVRPKSGNG